MVDFTILSSSPTSENLKCFLCKNYLCYFPISFCSNNTNICGRCTIPEGLVSSENNAFEEICQHFQFPCRFTGCPEEFLPKDIPNHEKKCPFRVVECIISKPERCQWQGSLSDLSRHCEEQHSDLVLGNYEFKMDPSDAEERDNLIEIEDNLLIFRRKYDAKNAKLVFSLSSCIYERGSKVYSCRLTVTSNNVSVTCNFDSSQECHEVSLKSLDSHDKPGTFLVKITPPENKNVTSVQCNEINTKLVRFLQCWSCSSITNATLYRCRRNSAAICSSCKKKHDQSCYPCRSLNSRVTVESVQFVDILKLVTCPCKYRGNGCGFSSNYDSLEEHQSFCEYKEVNCPFFDPESQCLWKDLKKDLCDHIVDDHKDLIYTSSDKIELPSEGETEMFFMKYAHRFFRLCYSYHNKDKHYMWSLQKIGNFDTKYAFDIAIVDEASRPRFLVGAQCSDLTGNDDVFEENVCYMKKDQMECLTQDEDWRLKFKVRIFKA